MTPKDHPAATRQKVGEWLRRGDPLSEGVREDETLRQLRARVLLRAADAAHAGDARVPALHALLTGRPAVRLATAATLALAVVGALWLAGRPVRPDSVAARGAVRPQPADARTSVGPSPLPRAPGRAEPQGRATTEGGARHRATDGRSAERAAGASTAGVDDTARKPLQVQFTTPGGTRIVWVLNPDFALQPMQQEE